MNICFNVVVSLKPSTSLQTIQSETWLVRDYWGHFSTKSEPIAAGLQELEICCASPVFFERAPSKKRVWIGGSKIAGPGVVCQWCPWTCHVAVRPVIVMKLKMPPALAIQSDQWQASQMGGWFWAIQAANPQKFAQWVQMYTYIHTHTYKHTYIHTYIHTHIHTYIRCHTYLIHNNDQITFTCLLYNCSWEARNEIWIGVFLAKSRSNTLTIDCQGGDLQPHQKLALG